MKSGCPLTLLFSWQSFSAIFSSSVLLLKLKDIFVTKSSGGFHGITARQGFVLWMVNKISHQEEECALRIIIISRTYVLTFDQIWFAAIGHYSFQASPCNLALAQMLMNLHWKEMKVLVYDFHFSIGMVISVCNS